MDGCRSSRNIEVHHIVARADGGSHEHENLLLLCGGHHDMLHEGKLTITGTGSSIAITKRAQPHVGCGKPEESVDRLCAILVCARPAELGGFSMHHIAVTTRFAM